MVLLTACAQSAAPVTLACGDGGPAGLSSVRMLVRFHGAVDGGAPQTLAQLQQHAQACVRFAGSVSPSAHAYLFTGEADATLLRQRLLGWGLVREALPDAQLKAH